MQVWDWSLWFPGVMVFRQLKTKAMKTGNQYSSQALGCCPISTKTHLHNGQTKAALGRKFDLFLSFKFGYCHKRKSYKTQFPVLFFCVENMTFFFCSYVG